MGRHNGKSETRKREVVGSGTITDITERKLSEEQFKKMNKRWRRLLAIPDLMFEADMDGTFIIII
jgi:PAS domain-containing protein